MFELLLIISALVLSTPLVSGHARLTNPPARTSAYYFGFPEVPPDYIDYQQNCGGYDHKVKLNGACGICGDAADDNPRQSERPNGKYATNKIVKTYKKGEIIEADIQMQANHLGWFYFRICPATSPDVEVTQECLNSHTLEIVEAPTPVKDKFSWEIPDRTVQGGGVFKFKLRLPSNLTCDRCVLQWDWLCANRWGICADGKGKAGCGIQETFRGCADVKIV